MTDVIKLFGEKRCNGCDKTKTSSEFWKSQSLCIECVKERQKNRWNSRSPKKRLEQHLKYKYSLTVNELMEELAKQNNCCAICDVQLPDLMVYNNRRREYAIDHNHETGKFRGILCLKCNSMLGMACDNVDILYKASVYLNERGSYFVDNAAVAKKGK